MTILFAQPIEQYPKHLAFSTVPVVTTPDVNFPAAFLLTRDSTQVCRYSADRGQGTPGVISWDFTRKRKFDTVSLVDTNASVAAVWEVFASNDGVNFVSISGAIPVWPNLAAPVHFFTPPEDEDLDPRKGSLSRISSFFHSSVVQNYRYIRVDVLDPGNIAFTVGRLFVGRSFKPKNSWQYGSGFSFEDTGTSERTDQGSLASLEGKTILSATVKMDFNSTDEMYDFLYEFNYWRKSTGEILCCLDLETKSRLQKNLFYATIKDGRKVVAEQFEAWSQTWIVERI